MKMTMMNLTVKTLNWKRVAVLAGVALPAALMASVGNAQEYCREYSRNVTIGGRVQQAYGTACRDSNGDWQVVNEQPNMQVQQVPQQVVIQQVVERPVYRPVYRPAYVDPFWPGTAISLGFNFGGGRHYDRWEREERFHDRFAYGRGNWGHHGGGRGDWGRGGEHGGGHGGGRH